MCIGVDIFDILPNDERVARYEADTYVLHNTFLVKPLFREIKRESQFAAFDIGVVVDKELR